MTSRLQEYFDICDKYGLISRKGLYYYRATIPNKYVYSNNIVLEYCIETDSILMADEVRIIENTNKIHFSFTNSTGVPYTQPGFELNLWYLHQFELQLKEKEYKQKCNNIQNDF